MAREELPGVKFFLNDTVTITSGGEDDQVVTVISLIEIQPEPIYLVKTQQGKDIRALQSRLSATDT